MIIKVAVIFSDCILVTCQTTFRVCCQAWRPYLQKDIDNLEKVQRRVTKMIPELSTLSYEQRLERTGLISLELRRLRADLIEVFKIFKGLEDVDLSTFFTLSESRRTRGHQLKLKKYHCNLDIRKYFFSQRVIAEWNNLPPKAVNSTSVNSFKNILDPILQKRRGLYISQKRLPAPVITIPSTS